MIQVAERTAETSEAMIPRKPLVGARFADEVTCVERGIYSVSSRFESQASRICAALLAF